MTNQNIKTEFYLTTDDLYKAAVKLYDDTTTREEYLSYIQNRALYNYVNKNDQLRPITYIEWVTFRLSKHPYWKDSDYIYFDPSFSYDSFNTYNGRIYVGNEPVTDEILKRLPLTPQGVYFYSYYLQRTFNKHKSRKNIAL